MNYDWYKIINRAEFAATGLVSRELTLVLEGVGTVDVMVTKGRHYALLYNGVFLPLGVTDANPFAFDGHAVFIDVNEDIWLGIETT